MEVLRWGSASHLSEAAFPACRLQPGAGVFGLTSERKASFRSNKGAEASGTQAGRRTPSPHVLGSPPPGLSCSRGVLFSPRASLSSGPFCRTKQKGKVLSRWFLWGCHRAPGHALAWGRPQTRPVVTVFRSLTGRLKPGMFSEPITCVSWASESFFPAGEAAPLLVDFRPLHPPAAPHSPTPSSVHHRKRLARRPGQGPLWSFPASAAQAGFQSDSRKASAASTQGHTCPGSPELPSAPGEGQL